MISSHPSGCSVSPVCSQTGACNQGEEGLKILLRQFAGTPPALLRLRLIIRTTR